jgi:hypothetical protein
LTGTGGAPNEVDMGRMAGRRVRAQWYDPTSGLYVGAHGSPFAATGTRQLRPPGRNQDGHSDRVLVLTTTR